MHFSYRNFLILQWIIIGVYCEYCAVDFLTKVLNHGTPNELRAMTILFTFGLPFLYGAYLGIKNHLRFFTIGKINSTILFLYLLFAVIMGSESFTYWIISWAILLLSIMNLFWLQKNNG